MGQPSMRITVDAAMRARDVSRPRSGSGRSPDDGQAGRTPRPAGTTAEDTGAGGAGARNTGAKSTEPNSTGSSGTEPKSTGARNTKAAKNERRRLGKRGAVRRPSAEDGL